MTEKSELMIGWASRDATPCGKKVDLCGQFHMRVTREINDPVTVTALTLLPEGSEDNAVVFVSCDTAVIPAYLIKECEAKIRRISEKFPLDKLILNATHTHAAPNIRDGFFDYDSLPEDTKKDLMTPPVYRDFLSDKIAEAAVESWSGRKKGSVAWGTGYAVVGRNRRISYLEDFEQKNYPGQVIRKNARMYGGSNDPNFSHVEGYEDHSVQFLFTFDQEEKLTGAVINIACPSQCTEGWSRLSADYWHDTRELIRGDYGRGLFILPQCSAAGDQSPHILVKKQAEARMLALKEGADPAKLDFDVAQRREIARRIKAAFDDTLEWASKDKRGRAEMLHTVKRLNISRRMVTDEERAQNLEWLEKNAPARERFTARCEDIVKKYEEQKKQPSFPVEIHAVRLGEIAFVTNPFELFLDYGLRIQARSPAEQTFCVQLAGSRLPDEWLSGAPERFPVRGGTYLPTKRAEDGGDYGASVYCNNIGSKGGQELVGETLAALSRLFTKQSSS